MSERGYRVSYDIRKTFVPKRIDLKTGEISCETLHHMVFNVSFPEKPIRGIFEEDPRHISGNVSNTELHQSK